MTAIIGLLTLYLAILHWQDGLQRMYEDRISAGRNFKMSASYMGIAVIEIYTSGGLSVAYLMHYPVV